VVLDAAQVATELSFKDIKVQVHPIEDVTALVLPQGDAPVVVADTGHLSFGASAEVVARLAEQGNRKVKRVGPPFVALPTSAPLEKEWYPSTEDISSAICSLLDIKPIQSTAEIATDNAFKGPF
jgi:pyruvate/2-oxoglutarate/acetoin dehydrogenase E1 component